MYHSSHANMKLSYLFMAKSKIKSQLLSYFLLLLILFIYVSFFCRLFVAIGVSRWVFSDEFSNFVAINLVSL